jgi:hypothetical protein
MLSNNIYIIHYINKIYDLEIHANPMKRDGGSRSFAPNTDLIPFLRIPFNHHLVQSLHHRYETAGSRRLIPLHHESQRRPSQLRSAGPPTHSPPPVWPSSAIPSPATHRVEEQIAGGWPLPVSTRAYLRVSSSRQDGGARPSPPPAEAAAPDRPSVVEQRTRPSRASGAVELRPRRLLRRP